MLFETNKLDGNADCLYTGNFLVSKQYSPRAGMMVSIMHTTTSDKRQTHCSLNTTTNISLKNSWIDLQNIFSSSLFHGELWSLKEIIIIKRRRKTRKGGRIVMGSEHNKSLAHLFLLFSLFLAFTYTRTHY